MTRRQEQTTKEREAAEGTSRERKALDNARIVMGNLIHTRYVLGTVNSKEARKIAQELDARIEWLIEESEAYRMVAAQMWLNKLQSEANGASGADECGELKAMQQR